VLAEKIDANGTRLGPEKRPGRDSTCGQFLTGAGEKFTGTPSGTPLAMFKILLCGSGLWNVISVA
jgi:hypothetical protein